MFQRDLRSLVAKMERREILKENEVYSNWKMYTNYNGHFTRMMCAGTDITKERTYATCCWNNTSASLPHIMCGKQEKRGKKKRKQSWQCVMYLRTQPKRMQLFGKTSVAILLEIHQSHGCRCNKRLRKTIDAFHSTPEWEPGNLSGQFFTGKGGWL